LDTAVGESEIAENFVVRSAATLPGKETESPVERQMMAGTQRLGFKLPVREYVQSCCFIGVRVSTSLPDLVSVSVSNITLSFFTYTEIDVSCGRTFETEYPFLWYHVQPVNLSSANPDGQSFRQKNFLHDPKS
jgi:hypothetical protein